jgi:superfamily II DNA or RNA helicase
MDFTYQDREYQTRLVGSTVGAFINDDEKLGRTLSSVLILSPCGSGKTVTAMRIIEELYHQGYRKVVFIAHRHKLLNQAISYLKTMGLSERLFQFQAAQFIRQFEDEVHFQDKHIRSIKMQEGNGKR